MRRAGIRRRVVVEGRVQGVWYRQSCLREALAANVAGWVRNNDDGTVEAVLEGDVTAVDSVVTWMRTGPPHALVTHILVVAEPPKGERGFSVQ